MSQHIDIVAADGRTLRGTLYRAVSGVIPSAVEGSPATRGERGASEGDPSTALGMTHATDRAVLINSAMGVRRRYYDAFAHFLAANGFNVVTFDYRGVGDSRNGSLRTDDASLRDWGLLDIPAAIDWIHRELRPRTLSVVGHSAGGQLVGLAPNAKTLERAVLVASQSGSWRLWPGLRKYGLAALWYTMPLIARAAGYFPSKLLGLGSEDLPRNVATQWAVWGQHRDYLFAFNDTRGYGELRLPILAVSFADDSYAPRLAVEALLERYPAATIDHRHVGPRGIKHFGFFRRGVCEELWADTVTFLR